MTSINDQLKSVGINTIEANKSRSNETPSVSVGKASAKNIINGAVTLTPIIVALLNKDESNVKRGLSIMLNNVRKTHQVLVDSAAQNNYTLTFADYVLFNRLALEVNCQRLSANVTISDQVLAQALNSAYTQDSIYAEYMDVEMLDDEMSLQYVALAKLAKVIFVGILKQTDIVDDEVASELLEYVIEEVDSHIRQTLEEQVKAEEKHLIRSKILEFSSDILETIIQKEINKGLNIEDRVNYIKRSFKLAMSLMIDIVEINFIRAVQNDVY